MSSPRDGLLISDQSVDIGLGLIGALSDGIGPRPPGSRAEALACELIEAELREYGLEPIVEEFRSSRSFGPSYLALFGLALVAPFCERRSRWLGGLAGGLAAGLGIAESRFVLNTPLNVLRRETSRNVWALIEPSGEAERTVCLVSHMDSSRSGLMFHPKVTPHLGNAVAAAGAALMVQGLSPVLRCFRPGRLLVRLARVLIAAGFGLVLEREVRGQDVPGANDNASGAAACLCLASHFAQNPLERTRLVILVTGSEESGVFGMREFLASHDTCGWDFVNFDGVGADAPLRVLSKEGGPLSTLKADPALLEHVRALGEDYPDLRAEPLPDGSGLPYDATPVMEAGGRAISVVNQDGAIPNYHWPTDTANRISRPAFKRAVEFGTRLVQRLDGH